MYDIPLMPLLAKTVGMSEGLQMSDWQLLCHSSNNMTHQPWPYHLCVIPPGVPDPWAKSVCAATPIVLISTLAHLAGLHNWLMSAAFLSFRSHPTPPFLSFCLFPKPCLQLAASTSPRLSVHIHCVTTPISPQIISAHVHSSAREVSPLLGGDTKKICNTQSWNRNVVS